MDSIAETSFDENSIVKQKWINATDEEKRHFILALRAKVEITDVLPPPNHEDLHVLVMAGAYMLLFLLGTCGNSAVLTTIYHVIRSRRATLDNTLIYVIVLSCVDFGVCISLPFTVIDQILGFWMFGTVVCKLHAVLENFGKILSALILTAMSFDRYAGVCHPQKKWLRSRKLAICILVGLAAYALVTLCPLLWSFTARELVLFEKETAPYKLTRMRIEKCTMVNISSVVFTMFTVYQCILCYCFPLFLVAFFYSKLLHRLRQHARQFKSSHIPLMRISLYTLAVACFYFLCWTPFWIATVFAVYLEYAGEQSGSVPPVFVYCMYFIHALPFTNSAVNWILYGALNGQLQHRIKGRRSEITTTIYNNANGNPPTNSMLGKYERKDTLMSTPPKMNIESPMLSSNINGSLPQYAFGGLHPDRVSKSSNNMPDRSMELLSNDENESVPLSADDAIILQTFSDSFHASNDVNVRLMIAHDPTYL